MTTQGEPIRVLRVIARLNVGGPALHVSYLTSELDKIGYETTLVAGRVGPGEGSMDYVADDLGVEPRFVPELQREISALFDLRAVLRLRRLIRELRPQILHTHTAKAGAVGRVAALLAGSARPPVIVHTFHGHVLRGYFRPWKTYVFRQLERALARHTDALIAVSPEVRDDLVGLGVASPGGVAVVRLGLDLDRRLAVGPEAGAEVRTEVGVEDSTLVVAWLGRMTEIKRVDQLIQAFGRVVQEIPDAKLLLVGEGPLRPSLEALATGLGIAESVRFVGYRRDVASIYAAADVVALTSANEGTPVTLIEAQAAGVPVVSTDVGGASDIVEDGESGLLVPPGDVDAIARALVRLGLDPELRARFGARGTQRTLGRYSVPRLVADVDSLYRSLLAEAGARRRRSNRQVSAPLPRALPPAPPAAVGSAARKLRIVLLSQYFPPEVGATQSRMQTFAEYLADSGHDVTVICEMPNHPQGRIPDRYGGLLYEDDRSNAYRVIRVWVKASPEKTQATRMAFYLSYMIGATVLAPLAGRADVVIATSPPLFVGAAGLVIARVNRAPFVLDVRDLWPAAAVSLNQISSGAALRLAELLERTLYRQADAVVAVTHPFCDHIDRIRGRPPRTILIPNGTLEMFIDGTDERNRLGVPNDRFLATFAGTLGIAQGLSVILDAAGTTNGGIEFALVGEGPVKDALVAEVAHRRLGNVHFHPQVPLMGVPPILAGSDALIVPLSSHPTFADFVPSKMIDYMAAGRPVVLAASGEPARMLDAAGAGVVVPPEDGAALAEAVGWLQEHPEQARDMGARGREWARKRLRSVQAERFEQVLLDLAR
jgi:glycosyltransferase involved in cell wall biosynthesis